MNVHEFQGKSLLKRYNVDVQEGFTAETPDQAVEAARRLRKEFGSHIFVVKAQVHAGGRGKGGGIRLARSVEETGVVAEDMLGMNLVTPQTGPEGKKVHKVLIEQNAFYNGSSQPEELYFSIVLDREKGKYIIIYSPEGGTEIEEISKNSSSLIFKEEVDPKIGLQSFQIRNITFNLRINGQAFINMQKFIRGAYSTFIECDAQLLEINPLLKASDERIIAVDCKLVLDDNALFRHPDFSSMRDYKEENPAEVEAERHNLHYVKLDGNIGCMVNGAGLAMATMDIIKLSGGVPANFLDVGGNANAGTVEAGIRIISKDPSVKAVFINIFGGIVRCDRVANGIVEAYKSLSGINIPVVIRLQGTNSEEAKKIIENSGLPVFFSQSFREAAGKIYEILN